MPELSNPYIAGAPVTETSMFFGREDVFSWIERSLPGRYVDHILVIHGQRRVGKTSVLKQLHHRIPEHYIPVFFDLQGRTHTTLDRFLWWLAREITRVLKQEHNFDLANPMHKDFIQDQDYLENVFLSSLNPLLGERTLLLTFDEFDSLEDKDIRENLGNPLIDYLRRLTGQEGLSFIFSIGSSGQKLENMQASYTDFFKAALYKEISFLKKEDTYALITKPVEGLLEYDRAAIERIYKVTSGHPYFTQLVCHELFSECHKTGERRIRESDVEAVLEDVVERGTVNLKFVWDEASDLGKWTLASIAHLEGKKNLNALVKLMEAQRVRFNRQELESILLQLREKDVLTDKFDFVIELMQIWLKKNRPLERVREELIEINPIASRYIEIGLEYKDIGNHEKAMESFQEAISVDQDNIHAQVNVAAIYLDQQSYDEAVMAFERCLEIDNEDVNARTGLCAAHLAVGDIALISNKKHAAIQSYQRALSINPDHADARQRMADIHKQDAEKAVNAGRVIDALTAYKDALSFTPEDETLETRIQELQEQHRQQLIDGLVAKAEKERSKKRWGQAISALSEALELAPELDNLRNSLATLREEHRSDQLNTLKIQARAQARSEQWGESISSWQAYLALDPEDRNEAEVELQQTLHWSELSQKYNEARQAMSSKEYSQAIKLLKVIVFEDETYKDAARLLAQAIEAQRVTKRPFPLKWVIAGLGAIALAILGWWLAQPTSPLRMALLRTEEIATITPQPETPRHSQPTLEPSPVPTFDWITDFARPIMDEILDLTPDFGGDFSTQISECDASQPNEAPVLIATSSLALLGCPDIQATDFVLQFEFVVTEISDDSKLTILSRGDNINNYQFELLGDSSGFHSWETNIYTHGSGSPVNLSKGSVDVPSDVPNSITYIARGDQFAVYLNDEPLTYFQNSSSSGDQIEVILSPGFGSAEIEIVDLKFWNFDPPWVKDFVRPLLDLKTELPPDLNIDFSEEPDDWSLYSQEIYQIALGSGDGTVTLSALAEENIQRSHEGHTGIVYTVAFSPDGEEIASGATDGIVILWNTTTGLVRSLEGHSDSVRSVAYSPDGQTLASGSEDGTIILWDSGSGDRLITLKAPIYNEGENTRILSLAFSPDGQILAVGTENNGVMLWQVSSGELVRTLFGGGDTHSVSFSPTNDDLLATGDHNHISFWSISSGSRVQITELFALRTVTSLSFSPDGQHLVSGHDDGAVMIWDVSSGQQIQVLEEPKEYLFGDGLSARAFYSSNGFFLVSGTRYKGVKLWDTRSGELIHSFETTKQIMAMDINSDISSGISDGVLTVNRVNSSGNFFGMGNDPHNFIAQFDFSPQLTTEFSSLELAIFPSTPDGNSSFGNNFHLVLAEGNWTFGSDGEIFNQGSTSVVSLGSWATLTIISIQDQITILLNDQPITHIKNESQLDHESLSGHHEFGLNSPSGSTILLVDNYKLWDLDQIDLSSYGIN